MGSPDVRAFARNKRGCAGSLVWINFDRHALLDVIRRSAGKFAANVDDVRPQFRVAEQEFIGQSAIFEASVNRSTGVPLSATIDQSSVQLAEVSGFKEEAAPWYADQILPFDITLAGTNEVGAAAQPLA